jgi:hypothetical protein
LPGGAPLPTQVYSSNFIVMPAIAKCRTWHSAAQVAG